MYWLNCTWADGSESDYSDAAQRGLRYSKLNLAEAEAKRLTTPPLGGAVEINIIHDGTVLSTWLQGQSLAATWTQLRDKLEAAGLKGPGENGPNGGRK
jgi:hypothetical protein